MIAISCVAVICISALTAWRWWLNAQPGCTADEFAKVVKQLNKVTEDMAMVTQTADSVRSAVGMLKMAGGGR